MAEQAKAESSRADELRGAAVADILKSRRSKSRPRWVRAAGFGSVTTQEIADQLRRQFSVEIDKRKIEVKEPIKSLGSHPVLVKVHPKVHVSVTVKVQNE